MICKIKRSIDKVNNQSLLPRVVESKPDVNEVENVLKGMGE